MLDAHNSCNKTRLGSIASLPITQLITPTPLTPQTTQCPLESQDSAPVKPPLQTITDIRMGIPLGIFLQAGGYSIGLRQPVWYNWFFWVIVYRKACHDAKVHRAPMKGIVGNPHEGAYSIVVNDGYEDDIDEGDIMWVVHDSLGTVISAHLYAQMVHWGWWTG